MARGRIPDSDIEAIRQRAPLDEIVGEYVQLKPAGHDSLKGLSPFKDERTPSFHVRPAHGYYHCFSTGKGGDVFSFMMEMEQLTFPEAVEAVADQIEVGIGETEQLAAVVLHIGLATLRSVAQAVLVDAGDAGDAAGEADGDGVRGAAQARLRPRTAVCRRAGSIGRGVGVLG